MSGTAVPSIASEDFDECELGVALKLHRAAWHRSSGLAGRPRVLLCQSINQSMILMVLQLTATCWMVTISTSCVSFTEYAYTIQNIKLLRN